MSVAEYILGEKHVYTETVLDDDADVISPTSATAKLINRDTGVEIATLSVVTDSGLVQTTVIETQITAEGNYQIEWDISYTDDSVPALKTIYTDILAIVKDTTYLMKLVTRLRVWVDDTPDNKALRLKTDMEWKQWMIEAVRAFMSDDFTVEANANGQDDLNPQPTAGSDNEQLIILWSAYFHFQLGVTAIASERTQLFQVTYADAYGAVRDKIDFIKEQIESLDSDAAMQFLSESDIESYGQLIERRSDAIETWDTV